MLKHKCFFICLLVTFVIHFSCHKNSHKIGCSFFSLFFIQEALIAMAPKQKASNSPTGVKPDKNCNKSKKENVTALKDDDDNKNVNLGKN